MTTIQNGADYAPMAVRVTVAPAQSGSGTPSPENIRPLVGYTALHVYRSGADTGNPRDYSVQLPHALYGGKLEIDQTGAGTLTLEYLYVKGGWTQYATNANGYNSYRQSIALGYGNNDGSGFAYSNITASFGSFNSQTVAENRIQTPSTGTSQSYMALKSDLDPNDVEFLFRLKTPEVYAFSAEVIRSLLGVNNLWSDAGEAEITAYASGSGIYRATDNINFRGVDSMSVGLVVTDLPEVVIPEERVTFTNVPGRSGALAQTEGRSVFNDITLSVGLYCPEVTPSAIRAIGGYFRGAGELRLPNRPGGYYEARVVNQIELARILRGNKPRTFEAHFRCKPLFYLNAGLDPIEVESGEFLTNPSTVEAHPVIEIEGEGDVTLLVGDQTVQLTGLDGGIVLDGVLQEAYWDGILENAKMSGDFPTLGAGDTAISWTGTVTAVRVTPHWAEI